MAILVITQQKHVFKLIDKNNHKVWLSGPLFRYSINYFITAIIMTYHIQQGKREGT